jgi:hypothetical protein
VARHSWAGLLGSTINAHVVCSFRWAAPHWVKIVPWVLVGSRLAVCRAALLCLSPGIGGLEWALVRAPNGASAVVFPHGSSRFFQGGLLANTVPAPRRRGRCTPCAVVYTAPTPAAVPGRAVGLPAVGMAPKSQEGPRSPPQAGGTPGLGLGLRQLEAARAPCSS